jgi:hypothetical protein
MGQMPIIGGNGSANVIPNIGTIANLTGNFNGNLSDIQCTCNPPDIQTQFKAVFHLVELVEFTSPSKNMSQCCQNITRVSALKIGQSGFGKLLINATQNGLLLVNNGTVNGTATSTNVTIVNNGTGTNGTSGGSSDQPLSCTAVSTDGVFSFTGYFVDTVTQWMQGLLLTPNSMKFDFNCSQFQYTQQGTRLALHGLLGVPKGTKCSKDSSSSGSTDNSGSSGFGSGTEDSITCDGVQMTSGSVGAQLMWVNKVTDMQGQDYPVVCSDPVLYTSPTGGMNGTIGNNSTGVPTNGTNTGPLITNMDPTLDYYDLYWVIDTDQQVKTFTWDPKLGVAYYSSATRLHALSLGALLLLVAIALGLQS